MPTHATEVVERPSMFSSRFKIPHQDETTLADIFGRFEAAKAQVLQLQENLPRHMRSCVCGSFALLLFVVMVS